MGVCNKPDLATVDGQKKIIWGAKNVQGALKKVVQKKKKKGRQEKWEFTRAR